MRHSHETIPFRKPAAYSNIKISKRKSFVEINEMQQVIFVSFSSFWGMEP